MSKKRSKKDASSRTVRSILLILLAVAIVTGAFFLINDATVHFTLNGAADMVVECGYSYEEPGTTFTVEGSLTDVKEKHPDVEITGTVDAATVGTYDLTYTAKYWGKTYSISRKVTVKDTEAPVISLKTVNGYQPNWFDGYQEEGFSAVDKADGDLTKKVTTTQEGDTITYTVKDAHGNESSVQRTIQYGIGRPILTLSGGNIVSIGVNDTYTDPGFTAVDINGNNLNSYVVTSGSAEKHAEGQYVITYSLTSATGEVISAKRTVVRRSSSKGPVQVEPTEKTIYLTFDDGPSAYTSQLLDVLAKYNAKATFFVTVNSADDIIARAYKEGNAIGVHTASHNYNKIYASESAFWADFNQVQEMIKAQTGEYTKICRFPGGSSNRVSNFNPGIMSRLTNAVMEKGYQYFDWNVDSNDAGGTTTSDGVYSNVVKGCSGRKYAVVLQHDIKNYSVNAVERILKWGQENGYTFAPLTVNSPAAHHRINN